MIPRLSVTALAALSLLGPLAGPVEAFPNGQAPQSALAPISHPSVTVYLEKDAAAAWNTMRFCSITELSRDIFPTGANSAYRRLGVPADWPAPVYGTQHYFWGAFQAGRGNLAARPGTSNHGKARAVDLALATMRAHIDRVGRKYGWAKVEAFSEWWHVNYVGGFSGPDPGTSQRFPVLRVGSGFSCIAKAVKEVERRLGLEQDGLLEREDMEEVRVFQRRNGIEVASVVGPKTWAALRAKTREVPGDTVPRPSDAPAQGTDVRTLQGLLNDRFREAGLPASVLVRVDGLTGPQTEAAVRRFQKLRGLRVDGVAGPKTFAELRKPAAAAVAAARTLAAVKPAE